ncbi:MAG: ABC transporter substrate-binding protein [Acidobacteria bacterium]|nr:ABC transporter substrate-binding protein [Acidobacteriota bacterium]
MLSALWRNLIQLSRKLGLGLFLIAAISGLLLLTDSANRKGRGGMPRIGVLQFASVPALEDSMHGFLEELSRNGYKDGENISMQMYNAQGDLATNTAIAREMAGGKFSHVYTVSTNSLQAMASANRAGKVIHVFGAVADPVAANVGIKSLDSLDHPRHLAGIGSLMPVGELLKLAKKLQPELRTVGLPWNPTETNSQVCTRLARAAAKEVGLELIEGNVENSSVVQQVTDSLVARGAEAILISADITVATAIDSVIATANKAGISVFSVLPSAVQRGAVLAMGADYAAVGAESGKVMVRVLKGEAPAKIPIRNVIPILIGINQQAGQRVRRKWNFPPEMIENAAILVLADGQVKRKRSPETVPGAKPAKKMGLVYFAPEEGNDTCIQGIFEGLREKGYVEGRNLEVRRAHANADISSIPALLQNFDDQRLDLIFVLTTPCLAASCTVVKRTPVVFSYVYDPIAAGAGKSLDNHLPFITGTGSFPPIEETVRAIQALVPGVRSVGTIYNTSEANSAKVMSVARPLFEQAGIRLVEVPATSTSEVFQAAQVVTTRNIQALWVTGDNTALQAFSGIAQVAASKHMPLIINDPEFVSKGALAAVGIGWKESGRAGGQLAARVLDGDSPAAIPMQNYVVTKLVLNHKVAGRLHIRFPDWMLAEAAR